jgi:hypothetical protein
MSVFFVVRVQNVLEEPVDSGLVQVSFDGSPAPAPIRVGPGICEFTLPPQAQRIRLFVSIDGYWDVVQNFTIDQASQASKPTIKVDGEHTNVRGTYVVTRGDDFNVEAHVVVGHLRDVSADVERIAANATPPLSFALTPTEIWHSERDVVGAGGSAPLLNCQTRIVTPPSAARILFAERLTVPRLVAVVDPGWGETRFDAAFHYNLFLLPRPPWAAAEPFGPLDVDVLSRYLVEPLRNNPLNQPGRPERWGKALAYQNLVNPPKCILVLPVGTHDDMSGNLVRQNEMMRFVREVHFWLQRMQAIRTGVNRWPRHALGRVVLSCYSESGASLSSLLTPGGAGADDGFYRRVLRGIFVFDGVFGERRYNTAEFKRCADGIRAWYANGTGSRSLCLYTQFSPWWEQLNNVGGTLRRSPRGTRELTGSGLSVVYVSLPLWQREYPSIVPSNNKAGQGVVHQIVPALFMEHAVGVTSFD